VREERGAIGLYDGKYPAEQALANRPMTVDVLRRLYADAKSTLETAERDRLGVLAEKLRSAREASESAQKEFAAKYSDLEPADLAQRKTAGFEAVIAKQEQVVAVAQEAERGARTKVTQTDTALKIFLQQNREVTPASADMEILKDSELSRRIDRTD